MMECPAVRRAVPGRRRVIVRNEGGAGFADGFSVIDGFNDCQVFEVVFYHLRNFQQQVTAVGSRSFAPKGKCSMRRIECRLDVLFGRTCCFGEHLPINR